MRILFLSIMAKCGVFTHVKELAVYIKNFGFEAVVALVDNHMTRRVFGVTKADLHAMKQSLNDIPHFCFFSDEDLLRKTESFNADIIHVHSPILFSTAKKISEIKKVPFIITLHGKLNKNGHYHKFIRSAKWIIAIGPEVANSVCPELQNKTCIIYNGIDTNHFRPAEDVSLEKPLRVLWFGRTSGAEAKGAEYLSRAINMLCKKGLSLDAQIIGVPLGADVRGMKVCGWVHDPVDYLQWSHIVFARGRALREATACGNAGFLIAEGYGGLVRKSWFEKDKYPQLSGSLMHGYKPLSIDQISKDIMSIYFDTKRLKALRLEARETAEEYFDIRQMAENTCRVYENVLNDPFLLL